MKRIMAAAIGLLLLLGTVSFSEAVERRRRTSKTRTGIQIGAGAAVGAGIGALLGGGRGAAAGALIGGGALAGHSLARRNSGYGRRTRMIGTLATGTAVGAGLGAAIGGGKGAGIGALLGGGGSAIYALTRKDLKEPEYSTGRSRPVQTNQINSGGALPANAFNGVPIANDDPYVRLAGPQGACVGNLVANGSSAIY